MTQAELHDLQTKITDLEMRQALDYTEARQEELEALKANL